MLGHLESCMDTDILKMQTFPETQTRPSKPIPPVTHPRVSHSLTLYAWTEARKPPSTACAHACRSTLEPIAYSCVDVRRGRHWQSLLRHHTSHTQGSSSAEATFPVLRADNVATKPQPTKPRTSEKSKDSSGTCLCVCA